MGDMINITREEVTNLNMEDIANVDLEDMTLVSEVDVDDLMADVVEVQTILQCNNAGQIIDVNEIYEKLEELTYIRREQRIEYVATQLLYKLGIIVEKDVAPGERVFRFSIQNTGDNHADNSSWSHDTVAVISEVSVSEETRTQTDDSSSNEIATALNEDEDIAVHPHDASQNFVNLPPSVTCSKPVTSNENQPNAQASNSYIQRSDCCQESYPDAETLKKEADAETLKKEAELMYSSSPHHSFGQICTCLKAISTPSSDDDVVCHNRTPSHDEKLHSRRYCASAMHPQMSEDGDLNHEVTDKEGFQETDTNVESGQILVFNNVDSDTENMHKIVTKKLKIQGQHNKDEECEESEVTKSALFQQKVSGKRVEVTPSSFHEWKVSEEGEATLPSSAEQKVSAESVAVTLLSSYRDTTELIASQNKDDVIDLNISKPEEDSSLSYASCEDLNTSAVNLKQEIEDAHACYDLQNPSTDCEVDISHPSCNVSEIVQSENVSGMSGLPSNVQGSVDLDFVIVQKTNVEFNGTGKETGGIVTDFEMIFPDFDTDTSGIFENRSQFDFLTNATKLQGEHNPTAVAEAEEHCDTSSRFTDSHVSRDSLDNLDEEHNDDRIVAKLQEVFPDAKTNYLTEISRKFNSLTNMVNMVLDCNENEQNYDVGDTVLEAVPSVSASIPKQPSQGCRKKEITYEEFESSLPHIDPVFLKEIWENIGTNYSAVKEFISQQTQETLCDNHFHTLLSLFPKPDPAFLLEKCSVIDSNKAASKDFMKEQLQNKTDACYSTLQAMFPQADPAYLHQKCNEIGNDETAMRVFVTEQLEKNENDDMYHNLLAIFPDTDPTFLHETAKWIGDDEYAMKVFITQQLEEIDAVKFPTLLAVLPDADPDYLKATFQKIGNDEESIKEFLLDALENRDYPTREAFLRRQKMAILQRKYKEEFSIEDFLETIPDPWKHFCEVKYSNTSELIMNHGLAYLETRYREIALDEIRKSFKRNEHNLTLTCKELERWNGPIQPLRETFICTVPDTEDIPVSFLQELHLLKMRTRLRIFIEREKQRKEEAFEMARAKGELLECQCCFDLEMVKNMAACTDGHPFCKTCIKKAAEIAIGNGQSGFSCLAECSAEFSLKVLQTVLKPTMISRMLQKRQLEEIEAAGIDLERCPFCDFMTVAPSDSKVFFCFNPQCMRDSCRKCKRRSHIPLGCDEVETKEVTMRTFIEDRMTDALVRTCWKCKRRFIKEAGCNKMTCTCGAVMCYICRSAVTDYSHFNGQGGTEFDKCPLYSDLEVIHGVAVMEEGMKAKKEVQAQNPDIELKHDPTESLGTPQ